MIEAMIGMAGILVGAFLGPTLQFFFNKLTRNDSWKRESLEKQLKQLYRPLYEKCVILADSDPEHYFCDWDSEEFRDWLRNALNIIIPKIDLASDEILEKIHSMRENACESYDAEKDVRYLYQHIDKKFCSLRKELKIS